MRLDLSKVGNICIGDQIAFIFAQRLEFGTVMGFGYTKFNNKLNPYLKIAEHPGKQILVQSVEQITNRTGKRSNDSLRG